MRLSLRALGKCLIRPRCLPARVWWWSVVMEFSTNLARDMGLQEVITGVGYMSGPPLGGLLYTYLGIRPMYVCM